MYACSIPNGFRHRALDVIARINEQDALRRAIRHVLTRAAECIDVDTGIFESVLYYVKCTSFVTRTINIGIRNSL
jgi:hypothetical protein